MKRLRIENNIQLLVVMSGLVAIVLMVLVCSGALTPQQAQLPGGFGVGLFVSALLLWLSESPPGILLP
jgi:hypothetical protein